MGGECALSQPFLPAGIYSTLVTVTDDDGASSSYETLVVVYDPSGGFVTGGGWIDSPAGVYVPDAAFTGKAIFGLSPSTSKYKKGTSGPSLTVATAPSRARKRCAIL